MEKSDFWNNDLLNWFKERNIQKLENDDGCIYNDGLFNVILFKRDEIIYINILGLGDYKLLMLDILLNSKTCNYNYGKRKGTISLDSCLVILNKIKEISEITIGKYLELSRDYFFAFSFLNGMIRRNKNSFYTKFDGDEIVVNFSAGQITVVRSQLDKEIKIGYNFKPDENLKDIIIFLTKTLIETDKEMPKQKFPKVW